ncbi:glycosyltransferase family 4 protein [Marilutibacter alkalisoli]|nr:glycosyltransferase family 4 protein [Lysobacter alkalisoli]
MARIIALTSRLPFPPREGHQLRSWHLLKALAARHEVTLLSFVRRDDDLAGLDCLRKTFKAVHVFPIPSEHSGVSRARALLRGVGGADPFVVAKYASDAMRDTLRQLAVDADAVHFDMLPLFAHVDCVPDGVPTVLNAHNVEHVLLEKRLGIESNPLRRWFIATQIGRLRAFERAACRRAQLILACSTDDAACLQALAPDTAIRVTPNGVDLDGNAPATTAPAHGARMVFVGQMGWFPNRDGVEWFMGEVLPNIVAARPDADFVLVGKPEGLAVPANLRRHVTLAGFVPDLRPIVHDAAIYVVPLRAGSGTRLKVLEAMALGKAIVTTRIGSEGIALRDGEDAMFADDAGDFARAVLELMDDPMKIARLGSFARGCAERHYGWDAIGLGLLRDYDTLLDCTSPPDAPPPPSRSATTRNVVTT